jgi:hypothetical protein
VEKSLPADTDLKAMDYHPVTVLGYRIKMFKGMHIRFPYL